MRDSVKLRWPSRGGRRVLPILAVFAALCLQPASAQQAAPVETQPLPPPVTAPIAPPAPPAVPGAGNGPAVTGTAPSHIPPPPAVGIPPPPLPPAVTAVPPAPQAPQAATPPAQAPAAPAPEAVPDPTAPAMIMLEAKPVLSFKGESSWDDGFDNLTKAFQRLDREAKRLKLATRGQPRAYFLWSDDNNFRYEAQLFLEQEPQPPPRLPSDIKIGLSPAGKALQFTHTGAYDDLEGTYDLIAAYLDEKKLVTRNLFVEEYMKLPKTAEDVDLEVNIFVLID